MRKVFIPGAVLIIFLIAGGPPAEAQDEQHPPKFQLTSTDLAVTYTTQESSVTPGGSNFWLQGASLDGGLTFFHRFGLATNLTGAYASNIAPGVGLGTLAIAAGPRYTYDLRTNSKHETRIFADALAGAVKGFGSVFPTGTGVNHTADSFTWQAGGGIDVGISKHLAIRAQADYVRNYLPNNASNIQDNIRVSVGVTYHVGKH
jgi:hypothetical protein